MTRDLETHDFIESGCPMGRFCIGVCVGLCLLLPTLMVEAAELVPPVQPDIPLLHRSAQGSVKSLRAHDEVMGAPACGAICAPPRARLGPEDSEIQMGNTSAFDLINEKRELRFKWQGSKEGIREHSMKLRVSRNRTALMWEGRF